MNKTDAAWSTPLSDRDLHPRRVDIWRIGLDLPLAILARLATLLSRDEAERASRFHFPADRDHFIAAHGGLRAVLAPYLRCPPEQLTFSLNPYGKPALPDQALDFNLSHSGDLALVAVARGRRVGIDVERIRPGSFSQVLAQQYFSKFEYAELQRFPLEQQETAFFACWTRKEAYIKAQGSGLSLPLESFDVSLGPQEPARLRATRPDPGEAARWSLFALEVAPGYQAAVVVEGQDLELRLWDGNYLFS